MSVSTDYGVSFNRILVDPLQVSSGKITLPQGMTVGTLIIKFHALGYQDAIVNQEVHMVPTAETRIKTTDNRVVQVDEERKLIFVNPLATVADIKSKITSNNGTTQRYTFVYSDGDHTVTYGDNAIIRPFHSSALHVTAQDGSTVDYYTVLVNQ